MKLKYITKRLSLLVLTVAPLFIACSDASAQENVNSSGHAVFPKPNIPFNPKTYVIYKTDKKIQVDGKIDERIWDEARWTDNFVPMDGDEDAKPEHRTRVKLLWDNTYLYVAAELEEDHIWGTMTKRNSSLYLDNAFEVFVDPNGDSHNYVEFEINALGTIWDLFLTKPYRDGAQMLSNWNLLDYRSAVALYGDINNPSNTDEKWTTEIALPLGALLEVAPGSRVVRDGDQWKVNFARAQRRLRVEDGKYELKENSDTRRPYRSDFTVWSPQGLDDIHYPEMWGRVQFSGHIPGEGTDEVKPDPESKIKWALRQVYYQMHEFYMNNEFYTDDSDRLNIDDIKVDGMDFSPRIETTSTMFEISVRGFDEKTTWHIRQDGLVWSY